MTRLANIKRLKVHFLGAPRENRQKMNMILQRYADGEVNNWKTVENAMIALSHPSMFGPRKVLQLYQKTMGIKIEKPMLAKLKQNFTLRVLLFTNAPTVMGPAENHLTEAQQKTYKKYITKKYPKHRLFWAGRLDVAMGSEEYFASIKDKLMTSVPKSKAWKEIHKICLADAIFKNRERIAKGYLHGIMVLSYDKKPEVAGAAPLLTQPLNHYTPATTMQCKTVPDLTWPTALHGNTTKALSTTPYHLRSRQRSGLRLAKTNWSLAQPRHDAKPPTRR